MGNDVIEGSDVARSDKLRISLAKDKKIINVKSIFNRKIANNILIEISNNEVLINFDSVLPEPKNIILKFIYFIIFIPIVLPILIPLLLIDSFLLFIHKIPKDYNLFNDNKENIVDNKSKIE